MPSLPAAAGARGGNAGLADPLLANGGDGARKISANDKYWVAADEEEMRAVKESGGEDGRPLLFRTFKIKGALLHPYRCVTAYSLVIHFLCALGSSLYANEWPCLENCDCRTCPKRIKTDNANST